MCEVCCHFVFVIYAAAGLVVIGSVAMRGYQLLARGFRVRCPRCGGTGECHDRLKMLMDSGRLRTLPFGLSQCQLSGCGYELGSLWQRVRKGGPLPKVKSPEREEYSRRTVR